MHASCREERRGNESVKKTKEGNIEKAMRRHNAKWSATASLLRGFKRRRIDCSTSKN
jgi:hypothetical protein